MVIFGDCCQLRWFNLGSFCNLNNIVIDDCIHLCRGVGSSIFLYPGVYAFWPKSQRCILFWVLLCHPPYPLHTLVCIYNCICQPTDSMDQDFLNQFSTRESKRYIIFCNILRTFNKPRQEEHSVKSLIFVGFC